MFILKGLRNDFLQVFIAKGLGEFCERVRRSWEAAEGRERGTELTAHKGNTKGMALSTEKLRVLDSKLEPF